MFRRLMPLMLLAVLAITGCSTLEGRYYLGTKQYDQGIEALTQKLQEEPQDHSAHYYLARYYLAKNMPDKAYGYISKAIELEPDNSEYHFWKGITHWARSEFDKEKSEYQKALAINPRNQYALLYLGHNLLDNKNWKEALTQYEEVLTWDKYDPEALFFKAKALKGLKQKKEEQEAWLTYLKYYPDGKNGLQAVDALNALGDYSWRNHYIGKRRVTLQAIEFEENTDVIKDESKASLKVIGAMLKKSENIVLHIVTYVKGNTQLARDRAKRVKEYILTYYPDVEAKQLPLSWFAVAEKVSTKSATTLDQSVNFITDNKK